jgi:hypothetical protein
MSPRPQSAFKAIVILLTLLALETVALIWLWISSRPSNLAPRPVENAVARAYPGVDFTKIYSGMSAKDIDELQRDCLAVRNVYAPFLEFRPLPMTNRFVTITSAGFRVGQTEQPWPPLKTDFVVFVFGGSTTFGFGVRSHETVVAALERELAALYPQRKVQCYNFGVPYYYSTQERILFEKLLEEGAIPNLAIFIDGLNDFYYADGTAALTEKLTHFIAPDLPSEPKLELSTEPDRATAVRGVIHRYEAHTRTAKAIGDAYGVRTIFVGQPVPFFYFPIPRPEMYPFRVTWIDHHELCRWGYDRFEAAARSGEFGSNFVWCGDAFANATNIMYVDAFHYSAAGATMLARSFVVRASEQRLLSSALR